MQRDFISVNFITMTEDELRRLLNERNDLLQNLTATQERCSVLLEETRSQRRVIAVLEQTLNNLKGAVGRTIKLLRHD